MREHFYSLFAKMLVFIGGIVLSIPILLYLFAWSMSGYVPQLFDILILTGYTIIGLIVILTGGIIQRRLGEREPLLANNGGPIHSGRVWKKGAEPGLFQTWCGLLVSINRDSGATAHVGYRIVRAKHATCKDCAQGKGRSILDANAHTGEF